MNDSPKQTARWQVSLKSLLVVTLVMAVALGYWSNYHTENNMTGGDSPSAFVVGFAVAFSVVLLVPRWWVAVFAASVTTTAIQFFDKGLHQSEPWQIIFLLPIGSICLAPVFFPVVLLGWAFGSKMNERSE